MDEKTIKRIKKIYIGQIVNRILLILAMLFVIANVAVTVFVGVKIKEFSTMIEPAVEVISAVDPEELNKTLTTINNAIDILKVNELLDTLGKIDFEGISEVVTGIDVDKLNETLLKIDEAATFMENMGNGMKNVFGNFGFNIN